MQFQTPLKKGKEINPKLPFLEETKLLVIDIQVQEPKFSAQSWRWCLQDHMSHTRVCNTLSSVLPLALLIKCESEWIRYPRKASKIENNLSPYWCRSMYATAQLHLCPSPIRAVTWLWSNPASVTYCEALWLITLQSSQWLLRVLNGSLLPFPIQPTSHSGHRGFFSIQSQSVISLSLYPMDHFQQRLWQAARESICTIAAPV